MDPSAASHLRTLKGFNFVVLFLFHPPDFEVVDSSINCNDLYAGVRMKRTLLNKEVDIRPRRHPFIRKSCGN